MREIEVIGGGLAGLALAIALRKREVPVTVREAGNYPRHRVCGEFVNGVTLETLETLGIDQIFSDALRHRRTKWWCGSEKILEADLPRPALGLSRWTMDQRLREELEACGGELRTRDRATPEARPGRVWTAGRKLAKGSSLVGLKAHFEGVQLDGFLEMHLGRGGYLGLTPIEKDRSRVNVCGLFQSDEKFPSGNPIGSALRRSGLTQLADRLSDARMVPASLTGISGIALGGQGHRGQLCTLGDAERMIPPFTGNGMSMAFESAECALAPLLDYASGRSGWDESRQEIHRNLDQRFQKRISTALILQKCLFNPVGQFILSTAGRTGVLPFSWLHGRLT